MLIILDTSKLYYSSHRKRFCADKRPIANSTFAIGGGSCSADSFVVAENFVLRTNISGGNPAHRKSAKRYQ